MRVDLSTGELLGSMPAPRVQPLEGFGYCRVAQSRARASALCSSGLPASTRLLLLILAEVQRTGCCPMGPETWEPALGVTASEAELLIEELMDVGVLTGDSDLYCLHVHGRSVDKGGTRGRRGCGQAARASKRKRVARPKARGYPVLARTVKPFVPPGLSATRVAAVSCSM